MDEADTRWGRRWAADVSNAIGARDSVTSPETAPRKAGVSNAKATDTWLVNALPPSMLVKTGVVSNVISAEK